MFKASLLFLALSNLLEAAEGVMEILEIKVLVVLVVVVLVTPLALVFLAVLEIHRVHLHRKGTTEVLALAPRLRREVEGVVALVQ
jgi:hypothetical protein